MIEQFHFLRPVWLLAFLPLAILLWFQIKNGVFNASWQKIIDPKLLPYLLESSGVSKISWIVPVTVTAGILCVIALAGPTWNKTPQPLFQQKPALVVLLDLSRSMDVADLKPSRLARARRKIHDLLGFREEGQTALVVFAADAFVVTPLSDDIETIRALVPSLTTDIMPRQGSRAHKAIEIAIQLLKNAGSNQGDILLISDGLSSEDVVLSRQLFEQNPGFRLSALAVGSESGGPITLPEGGFLKSNTGDIVISKLDQSSLAILATAGGGSFRIAGLDDSDLRQLTTEFEQSQFAQESQSAGIEADLWREQGPWLVLLIIPLAALAFRRGFLLCVALFLLPFAPDSHAIDWDSLWQNDNQRGLNLYQQGRHKESLEWFDQEDWKASASYQSGDYDKSVELWQGRKDLRSQYNMANALAKLGRYQEALDTYDKVLEVDPGNNDAIYNRKLVEDAMKQQSSESEQGDPSEQDQQDEQGQQSKGDSESNQDGEQQSENQSESSDQQDPAGQSSESEEQKAELESENEPSQSAEAEPVEAEEDSSKAQQAEQVEPEIDPEEQLSKQALQQWLRKIPDDPGGLLRRKFLYQYSQTKSEGGETDPW
ncbi:MAG: Ca-activated chloride channel family protein [Gammaproteobacteria bacterium]|jgi:Ca-activated chloride channel family protein